MQFMLLSFHPIQFREKMNLKFTSISLLKLAIDFTNVGNSLPIENRTSSLAELKCDCNIGIQAVAYVISLLSDKDPTADYSKTESVCYKSMNKQF